MSRPQLTETRMTGCPAHDRETSGDLKYESPGVLPEVTAVISISIPTQRHEVHGPHSHSSDYHSAFQRKSQPWTSGYLFSL